MLRPAARALRYFGALGACAALAVGAVHVTTPAARSKLARPSPDGTPTQAKRSAILSPVTWR
jgi:hypothetical protein